MMNQAPIEPMSSVDRRSEVENRQFDGLRSVKWRINLGVLASSSSSVDDLRRVTADSRRRYAGLRRRLLIDPQILKEVSRSDDVVIDNPLSQNPDSTWGRFFRSAELEKMVDQDLSRLYPERGSYFQTPGCQSMLRRILLLWCLRHAEFGYRQGMHELLAPLLYVLHVDVEHISKIRNQFEDHFMDNFDNLSSHENDLTFNFDLKKSSEYAEKDKVSPHENSPPSTETDKQMIISLTDEYGAEGELGIVISEKFIEHDAYSMFDALMIGSNGSVAMAEFFSPSPVIQSQSGLPPIIEASSALYHLLSFVDSSLHSHLVELRVEPQYFALRWFRVLFGREFSLGDLLIIWDEIFASDNSKMDQNVLCSHRGALISALAVSMLLYLRSSLLATEHATSCLQRLLNFPENVDLNKLLEKAKSLQNLALETNISLSASSSLLSLTLLETPNNLSKSAAWRRRSDSFDAVSPKTPLHKQVSVSYWEEKWRVHHRDEELKRGIPKKNVPEHKKGWTDKVKVSLTRTESDPSPGNLSNSRKIPKSSVRRSLLKDLSRELGLEEDIDDVIDHNVSRDKEEVLTEEEEEEENSEDGSCKDVTCTNPGSEESSSVFSDPASPRFETHEQEIESEKSSVECNLSLDESDDRSQTVSEESSLPVSHSPKEVSLSPESVSEVIKEKKPVSGKFQWFWKFGRNVATEDSSECSKSANGGIEPNASSGHSVPDGAADSVEPADQKVMGTLKNLGNTMLEHIQVIESVFQQDRVGQVGSLENFSKNILVGKGQVTAMTALKELRKISNILSEM